MTRVVGRALGLGIVGWSPLGGGVLTGKYRKGETGRAEGLGGRVFQPENSAQRTAIIDAVIAVAAETGVTPGEIAIAWAAVKGVLPIAGSRSVSQMERYLSALMTLLPSDQIARLDGVSHPAPVFPYTMIHDPQVRQGSAAAKLDRIDLPPRPVA